MTEAEHRAYCQGYTAGLKRADEPREYASIVGIIVGGKIVHAKITRNVARMYQMRESCP